MKTAYPILQSGFLAVSENGLDKMPQPEEDKIVKAIELGKPFDSSGNPFFYDPAIETLFKEFTDDNRKIKSFEFRERFLIEIKNNLAFTKFSDWISLQENSPYFTQMHRRFIDDTINFVNKGQREISIESWQGLIYPRMKTQLDMGQHFSKDTKWFLKEINPNLSFMISLWTSHQNGWQDLFTFAGIVFTSQTYRAV